jgi:DNA-binding NtrC family response regulator
MCRVLVIDDEESVRNNVKRRIEREGYDVDTADSQTEGIDKINTQMPSYDVVVTDMVMESPTSGLEILQTVLSRDVFSEVIVLTAYGNVANAVECMKRGAFDYVEKNIPGVDIYDLLALKLNQAVDRRKSSIATIRRIEHYK